MYNWFTFLYAWNQHNIVNQLYSNKLFFQKQIAVISKPLIHS